MVVVKAVHPVDVTLYLLGVFQLVVIRLEKIRELTSSSLREESNRGK
jgi:hypothetical protein